MRSLLKAAAQIASYFLLFGVFGAPAIVWWFGYVDDRAAAPLAAPFTQLPVEVVSLAAALAAVVVLAKLFGGPGLGDFGFSARWGAVHLGAGAGIGVGLVLLVLLTIFGLGMLSVDPRNGIPVDAVFFATALGVALNAATQEIMFRGYFLGVLREQYAEVPALIASSILFLAAHGGVFTEPLPMAAIGALNLFLAGVMLALAYLRSDSLWLPIGIHAAWNMTIALTGLSVTGQDLLGRPSPILLTGPSAITGGSLGIEGGLPGLLGPLVGVLAVAWYYRRRTVAGAAGDGL